MSKTQIRGPQKQGSNVLSTEVDRAVVKSYSRNTTAESKRDGQTAAAAILPLRRALWALAERLIPERLAGALRARTAPSDPTGRDGVRELRLAIADWLDPPPACRWCGGPVRPGDTPRECRASRAAARARRASPSPIAETVSVDLVDGTLHVYRPPRPWTPRPGRMCHPSPSRRATSAVARCGTLALYAAGQVDLATMAAALATPRGAASGYDVAADRDCRALLAACALTPPRDPHDDHATAWEDEGARLRHLGVALAEAALPPHRKRGVPRVVSQALAALQRARSHNLATNGRTGIAIQLRYASPRDGVTRGDLTQGAMIGLDRGGLDYDATQARYTTYAAAWSRQGAGEVFDARDLVGAPPWIYDLRRALAERLHLAGTTALRDLLRAVEAISEFRAQVGLGHAEHQTRRLQPGRGEVSDPVLSLTRAGRGDLHDVQDILYVMSMAEVHEAIPGTRPTRRIRRRLLGDAPDLAALAREVVAAAWPEAAKGKAPATPRRRLMRAKRGTRPKAPWASDAALKAYRGLCAAWSAGPPPADPEDVRERVAAWVALKLEVKPNSGSALLTALRHAAPVLVGVGSGGDDDEDTQGTDGAGGCERAHAILPAPDDFEAHHEEDHEARRWKVLLAALASLQSDDGTDAARGREAVEIVRRHHGLDSIADGGGGPGGGESFASIGESGLACSGRTMAKETVRKIYGKAIEALRLLAAGKHPELRAEDFEDAPTTASAVLVPLADPVALSASLATFNRRREAMVTAGA